MDSTQQTVSRSWTLLHSAMMHWSYRTQRHAFETSQPSIYFACRLTDAPGFHFPKQSNSFDVVTKGVRSSWRRHYPTLMWSCPLPHARNARRRAPTSIRRDSDHFSLAMCLRGVVSWMISCNLFEIHKDAVMAIEATIDLITKKSDGNYWIKGRRGLLNTGLGHLQGMVPFTETNRLLQKIVDFSAQWQKNHKAIWNDELHMFVFKCSSHYSVQPS